ncbi:MAG: hypothetical protein IMZ58_10155 [Thermoplasmata archaeon]|nr:hypothetical protein [Thermoplasmata archaeon]
MSGSNSFGSVNNVKGVDSSESFDMLICLSPQYVNNFLINIAVNKYIDAVKNDVGWNTKIIKITSEMNDFRKIDQVIESYYDKYSIKACIMVGEDIDTAKCADWDYLEAPSTTPWETIGGESRYYFDENGDVHSSGGTGNYSIDICISLLYPTHECSFPLKVMQIVRAFYKFSKNRDIFYSGDILAFADSEDSTSERSTREVCESMKKLGNLYYKEDPTNFEVLMSLSNSYSIYYVFGHSNPSLTDVSYDEVQEREGLFYARYIDILKVPFFMAGGCYVDGWWSDYKENNRLDPSIRKIWYGSRIFTSKYVRVMVLGFPSQTAGSNYNGTWTPYQNFIVNALPDLTSGKTLAESMIGKTYYYNDDQKVFGDPTFHFHIVK